MVDRLEFSRANFLRREENQEEAEPAAAPAEPEAGAEAPAGGGSILGNAPLLPQGSFRGGETGLAGKDVKTPDYHGAPSNQYTDSTGTLG